MQRLDQLPPLESSPFVTVVMPVRNEAAFIDRSLGAVLAQDYPPESFEVIVADGGSDDGTADRVRALASEAGGPSVRVVHNERQIVPVSLNRALAEARGALVVRVDGHCEVAPDYLSRCVAISRSTGAACVGGPIHTVGMDPTAQAIAAAQSSRFGVGGVAFRTSQRPGPVDTLAFGAYRREVFDVVGMFDEELVRNQDDEFNLRVTSAGGIIWMDPTITSTYHARSSMAALWRQYRLYGTYKVRVMQKHRTVPSVRHLVPAAFVSGVAGAALLTLVTRQARWLGLAVGPYLAANALAARSSAQHAGVPATPVAAATTVMHVAYGAGTLAGLVRFRGRFGDGVGWSGDGAGRSDTNDASRATTGGGGMDQGSQ